MVKAGLLIALAALGLACAPPQPARTTVQATRQAAPSTLPAPPAGSTILYGDSLAVEATQYLEAEIVERVKGGTAPCDWMAQMTVDRTSSPAKVIVAFSGNMRTA